MKIEIQDALPLIKRSGTFILQKSFPGFGQKQVRLGKNERVAKTRARRFLATAEVNGFEAAYAELKGRDVLKKGDDPTYEQMKELYLEFLKQSGKTHDPRTVQTNLNRVKNVMERCGFPTVGKIDKSKIFAAWFKGVENPNASQRRTFASAIRAAASVFKVAAMNYYASKGQKFKNPFLGMELSWPPLSFWAIRSEKIREFIYAG